MSIESKCRELLAQVIGEAPPASGDVLRDSTPGWDSVKHVEYIFLLEDEFDVTISEEDMTEIDSLFDAVGVVQQCRSDAA